MDSRGHGRSTRDARPYGYDLMADDVVGLMDVLKLPKADIVGQMRFIERTFGIAA